MKRRTVLTAVLALPAFGCSSDDDESRDDLVNYTLVPSGAYTGPLNASEPIVFGTGDYSGRRLYAIRTAFHLNAFWSSIQPKNGVPSPVPDIDLQSRALVGVFLGARPNACYDVAISKARRVDNSVVLTYQERIPSAFGGATCPPSGVYPFALAVVDVLPSEDIAFEEGAKIVIG